MQSHLWKSWIANLWHATLTHEWAVEHDADGMILLTALNPLALPSQSIILCSELSASLRSRQRNVLKQEKPGGCILDVRRVPSDRAV